MEILTSIWNSVQDFAGSPKVQETVKKAVKQARQKSVEKAEVKKAATEKKKEKLAKDPCSVMDKNTPIELDDKLNADQKSRLKGQIEDYRRRKGSMACGVKKIQVYDVTEYDKIKQKEYGKRPYNGANADYNGPGNRGGIRYTAEFYSENVANHEHAHVWDMTENEKVQETRDQVKEVSWAPVEGCGFGSSQMDMIHSNDGVTYNSSEFVTEYAATNHLEDFAETVEEVLDDPYHYCEDVGTSTSTSTLARHKAKIVCENPHIVSQKPSTFQRGQDYFHISQSRATKINKRENFETLTTKIENTKKPNEYKISERNQSGRYQSIGTIKLPLGMRAFNIRRIGKSNEFLVTGIDNTHNIRVMRIKQFSDQNNEPSFSITEGDAISQPNRMGSNILYNGANFKNGVIYPIIQKGGGEASLFYYDLKSDRIYLLRNQGEFLRNEFQRVDRVYDKNGKVYAMGLNKNNEMVTMELNIQLKS